MTYMNNTEYKPYLSIGKGIAALLIVILHTSPFIGISEKISFFFSNILSRYSVPYFFIVSGLLYKMKSNKNNYT